MVKIKDSVRITKRRLTNAERLEYGLEPNNSMTQDILSFVDSHPGCTNMQIAKGVGVDAKRVSALTVQLFQKNKLRRSLQTGFRRDFYFYYPSSSTLGYAHVKPVTRQPKPKPPAKVVHAVDAEPVIHISKPVENMGFLAKVEYLAKSYIYQHDNPTRVVKEIRDFVDFARRSK